MPADSSSPGGRRHFHRGRRGYDRRGGDRRATPPQQPQPGEAQRGDHLDVEQIMRDIRRSIAQRHGVELTDQQVQDLAARRLESILDPRTITPSLLDQLRRSAGARPDTVAAADRAEVPYEFEDTTLYESPSALTRAIRTLLQPILKLFFNPNPLIRALHVQSRLNVEAARREAERDQRQAEWNALHFEILQRMVQETAKVSLEVQSLALRTESLSAKVDFNERRVRGIEGAVHQVRPAGGRERERDREAGPPPPLEPSAAAPSAVAPGAETPAAEAPRRRRRRRRGRRGGGGMEAAPAGTPTAADTTADTSEAEQAEEADAETTGPGETVTTGVEAIVQDERSVAADIPLPQTIGPERVTPQLTSADPAAREEAAPDLPTEPKPDPDAPR